MSDAPHPATLTRLLGAAQEGDEEALGEGFALVYDELKTLAQRQRRRWRGNHTLNTTALVNEAYLKLLGSDPAGLEGRGHFFALASTAMRHLLCNYARDQNAQKRGGDVAKVPLDDLEQAVPNPSSPERADTLLALDDALNRLESVDPRQARVVECRFFGGLSVEETASALDVSPRTVKRDWAVAQAWLYRAMESE
jgi:RNA polymerase sigma factor (TIGR02999 family)